MVAFMAAVLFNSIGGKQSPVGGTSAPEGETQTWTEAVTSTTTTTTRATTTTTTKKSDGVGSVSKGDRVWLGHYPQNSASSDESIRWRVLKVSGDKALLVSEKILDCVRYNRNESVTWETSDLRVWLNSDFLDRAFSSSEQRLIAKTRLSNASNSEYGTDGGSSSSDRVFLLSEKEADELFSGNNDRKCVATDYAVSHGSAVSSTSKDSNGDYTSWWWLRSPGCQNNYAAHIRGSGEIDRKGTIVSYAKGSVRPAIWVYL